MEEFFEMPPLTDDEPVGIIFDNAKKMVQLSDGMCKYTCKINGVNKIPVDSPGTVEWSLTIKNIWDGIKWPISLGVEVISETEEKSNLFLLYRSNGSAGTSPKCFSGKNYSYGKLMSNKDNITIILDLDDKSIRFRHNGIDERVAFRFNNLKKSHFKLALILRPSAVIQLNDFVYEKSEPMMEEIENTEEFKEIYEELQDY